MITFYLTLLLLPPVGVAFLVYLAAEKTNTKSINGSTKTLFISTPIVYLTMIALTFYLAPTGELLISPTTDQYTTVSFIGAFAMGLVVVILYDFSYQLVYAALVTGIAGVSIPVFYKLIEWLNAADIEIDLSWLGAGGFYAIMFLTWIGLFGIVTYTFFRLSKGTNNSQEIREG